MLASGTFSEIYHDDLFRMVAPLSTFCSLYNLFLLPILDEEFLRGEAIFSKMDLIKMSSILKDVCIGVIVLMHPDKNTYREISRLDSMNQSFRPLSSSNSDRNSEGISKVAIVHHNSNLHEVDMKIKAKYFTHLFQV